MRRLCVFQPVYACSEGSLAEGLRFFATHEGPYAVHCQEGRDRTGVVAALLECFMGADYDEVRKDYMSTFFNYYGIEPRDADYDQIANNNIAATLRKLFGLEDLNNADLAGAAEDFFREIGLSGEELAALRATSQNPVLRENPNMPIWRTGPIAASARTKARTYSSLRRRWSTPMTTTCPSTTKTGTGSCGR